MTGSETYEYLIAEDEKGKEVLRIYFSGKGERSMIIDKADGIEVKCGEVPPSKGLKLFDAEGNRIKYAKERNNLLSELREKIP